MVDPSNSVKDKPASNDSRRGRLMLGLFVAALVAIVAWVVIAISQRDSMTKDAEGQAAVQKTIADPGDTKGNFNPNPSGVAGQGNPNSDQTASAGAGNRSGGQARGS